MPAASAAGRLVSPYLRALASPGGEEGEAACPEPAFIDAGLDLIACALRSVTGGVAAAGTAGSPAPGSLIGALKRHALGHLTEPGRTPEAVARACYVSVRQLHRAFAREGTSFGAWVREQRLRRCRDDLADRERGDRAIAEIAAGWGFGSAAHFSRAFRARFGISPIALRVAAGWREPGPAASQPGEAGSAGR